MAPTNDSRSSVPRAPTARGGREARRSRRRTALRAASVALGASLLGCASPTPKERPPSLVHLTDVLATAEVTSEPVPESARRTIDWTFDRKLADGWAPLSTRKWPWLSRIGTRPGSEGLALTLGPVPEPRGPLRIGGIRIDLEGKRFDDFDEVRIRARSSDRFAGITIAYDVDAEGALPQFLEFFLSPDEVPPLFNDGSVQTYVVPIRPREGADAPEELRSLGVVVGAPGEATLELLSVSLVPRGAEFEEAAGVRTIARAGEARQSLFAHAPATVSYPLTIPAGGRLDFALAVGRGEEVTYRVRAGGPDASDVVFEETVKDPEHWHQRSVDLAGRAGQSTTLTLEARSERAGAVALWGAPIVSGRRDDAPRPNVILYVIDGGGADLMSAFGYDRPTTPFLEELKKEGVLFGRAYANSTWTQPSTASFMTSLHHSVLGGLRRGVHSTAVPPEAVTLTEHLRRAGYQTASFTSNPNAGRIIGLERGVDVMWDLETENPSTSSADLHEMYWTFRERYPGGPTFVHFQTTDVHEPNEPVAPHAGRFVSPDEAKRETAWDEKMFQVAGSLFGTTSVTGFYDAALKRAGIPRHDYFETRRGLYDETMLHQDAQLRKLVEDLKARGEWERTLLVIGADHGHPAGTYARFGRGLFEPQPDRWEGALFDSYATRVPMMIVWPGKVPAGQAIDTPVSMIDVLPTLLELCGLPAPDVAQGRSLVPLMKDPAAGHPPVVLDEFRVDEATGELIGNLEVVDGRWGASLEIAPVAKGADPERGRHEVPAGGRWGAVHPRFDDVPRLLLYDLQEDPFARKAVNEDHAGEVARYEKQLALLWQSHLALARRFGQAETKALTPEQLEQLRALGYIR